MAYLSNVIVQLIWSQNCNPVILTLKPGGNIHSKGFYWMFITAKRGAYSTCSDLVNMSLFALSLELNLIYFEYIIPLFFILFISKKLEQYPIMRLNNIIPMEPRWVICNNLQETPNYSKGWKLNTCCDTNMLNSFQNGLPWLRDQSPSIIILLK